MTNKVKDPLVDVAGKPLRRQSRQGRRISITRKQLLAAITLVGVVGALSVNLDNITKFARSTIERLLGVPFTKPMILSEDHVLDPDDDAHHLLSFVLTNPADRYALLESIELEVAEYEDTTTYLLPDTLLWAEARTLQTTSGPAEKHVANVTLNPSKKIYPLFEGETIVFPKSETRRFEISVRTSAGGRYSYRVLHKWNVPELRAGLITTTNKYIINEPSTKGPRETEAWLATAQTGVLAFLPAEDVESMFDREKELIRLFFIPKEVKVTKGMESLSAPVHGLIVPLPPLAHNIAALSALNKMPEVVITTVLTPLPGNSRLAKNKIYVVDRESALIETAQDQHGDRVGRIVRGKGKVKKLLEELGVTNYQRCTDLLLDFSGKGASWVAWEFRQSGDIVLERFCGI